MKEKLLLLYIIRIESWLQKKARNEIFYCIRNDV